MPIIDIGQDAALPDRTNYDVTAERDPTFVDLVKANVENSNIVYNLANTLSHSSGEPDPSYDVYKNLQGYEGYADRFIGVENSDDAEWIKQRIDQETEQKSVMASGGLEGVAAGFAAGLMDPTMLIPVGGEAYATYRTGGRILEGAAKTALAVGTVTSADELALHSLQETRTGEESLGNIATATFMGGVLGGAAGALAPREASQAAASTERNLNIREEFADRGSIGAAAAPANTLEGQAIKDTVGLKAFRDPVLGFLDAKGAPDWTKAVAAKVLRNVDEVLSFQDPVARMNYSPAVETRNLNEKLNETPLVRNKNSEAGGFQASEIPVENAIKGWQLPKVAFYRELDKNFLTYRNAKSKVLTNAQDAVQSVADKVTGRSRPDGQLTYHEFGEEVMRASHNGDQSDIPEVAATAKALRQQIYDTHFDEAKNVGLVDEDAYKAAKEKSYAPFMWNKRAVNNNRPDITAKITQHLVAKRDAAAARVKAGLDTLGVGQGDVGELFKQAKADAREAEATTNAMQRKVDSTGAQIENKHLSINDASSRIDELTGQQERLYGKILNGRDRGEDDLSDLFNEFRSVSSRKKELFRQMTAREGEAEMKAQVLERRMAIVDKLTAHENDLAQRVDDFEAKLKDMTLDQYKASFHDEDLKNVAYQTVDRILGIDGNRLSYDNKLEPAGGSSAAGKRGNLKTRKFDMPYELAKDYLHHDIHSVVENYSRSMASDIELYRKFGTLDPEPQLKQIQYNYARLMEGANKDQARKLTEAQKSDVRDFKGTWERIRGTYGNNGGDDFASKWNAAQRVAMNLNYLSSLGGMTVSAFSDLARPVMLHGMMRVYGDGLRAMATDFKGFKAAAGEITESGTALDMVTHTTAKARAGFDENVPFANRAEAVTGAMAHSFTMATLMAPWNTAVKQFSGVVTQSRMMRAILKVADGGNPGAKEMEYLAENYIDKDMAKRIGEMHKQFGDESGKVIIPNAREWTDLQAQKTFRAAIRRDVDKSIVTPGQDKPLWMSKSGWKLLGQFRSFSIASTQRTLLAGLQQRDAAVLNGSALAIALGAFTYVTKSWQAGMEPDLSPARLVVEGVDRGGLTGWLMDANNVTEKISRGRVGVHPLIGGPPMSRYASRSTAEAIFGPTYGRMMNGIQVTGDAFSGDIKPADVQMMRRMMPYQNLIGVRTLFDEAEKNIDASIPQATKSK